MAELFRMLVSDLDKFARDMEMEDKRRIKAGETAVKVEGFRLMKVLKKEIRRGMPGGKRFAFLSMVAKRLPVRKKTIALSRLAIPVRYNAVREGKALAVNVGFVGGGGKAGKLSKSWARIAKAQQEGFTTTVNDEKRRRLLKRGIVLKKRKDPESKYFFLKKATKRFRTPARPIIAPFWQAHEREAMENIRSNFDRKMAGERI